MSEDEKQADGDIAAGDIEQDLRPWDPNEFQPPPQPQQPQQLSLDTDVLGNGFSDVLRSATPRNAERVPLPRLNSSNQTSPTGPMSSSVTIPPRPRPGRKPMDPTEQQDKRRLQNRLAQRNFRDKRQQKLSEALQELDHYKTQYKEEICDHNRRYHKLREHSDSLQLRVNELEEENKVLKRALSNGGNAASLSSTTSNSGPQYQTRSHRPGRFIGPYAGAPEPTPSDEYSETDFTNYRGRTRPSSTSMRPSMSTESTHTGYGSMDMQQAEIHCGFCTDPGNCYCKKASSAEPSFAAGNCESCINDPARRAACRQIAQQAGDPSGTVLAPMMSCSNFLDQVEQSGGRLASISQVVGGGQLQVYSSGTSGFEVQEQEAAQALQELAGK